MFVTHNEIGSHDSDIAQEEKSEERSVWSWRTVASVSVQKVDDSYVRANQYENIHDATRAQLTIAEKDATRRCAGGQIQGLRLLQVSPHGTPCHNHDYDVDDHEGKAPCHGHLPRNSSGTIFKHGHRQLTPRPQ